jgi:hypothetical protein
MGKIHYTPVHPGDVLRDELEEIGLTQSALARHIGVLPKTINEICRNGKQKRVKRPPTVEGLEVDEFIRRNADPIWLHQIEKWEFMIENEAPLETKGQTLFKVPPDI